MSWRASERQSPPGASHAYLRHRDRSYLDHIRISIEVIDRLGGIIGTPVETKHVDTRAGDVPHSQADNTLLRSLFPDVEPVALENGLQANVAWLRGYLATTSPRPPSRTDPVTACRPR